MHRIYFDKRTLAICSPTDQSLNDPNSVIYKPGSEPDFQSLILLFEKSKEISKLYIPTDQEEAVYRQICSQFAQINAGGGLVMNKRGDFLLIFRNGLWDLPKGKQEPGEDIRLSALREVEEECGIKDLEIRRLICITDHTYRFGDKFILKHTYWYRMLYNQPTELSPQTEENISKATWISKSSLPGFLDNTYPSIIEVFKNTHII